MLKTHIDTKGIAHITLSRPEVHNAFNAELIKALHDAFKKYGRDESVRAIVLSGEGKSFSAGADLNWMKAAATFSHADNITDAMALSDMLTRIHSCFKPVIALVQGAAMGGGVGLVACADIVIAVEGTKFALSEVRLGLTPATISPFVVEAIGPRKAKRYFMTAERFDAEKAKEIGLVHEVCATMDDAKTMLETVISHITKGGPIAVSSAKRLVLQVAGKDITDNLKTFTAHEIADRRTSEEGQEGISAFLEKRSADWSNKT